MGQGCRGGPALVGRVSQGLRRGHVVRVDLGIPLGSEQGLVRPAVVVSDQRLHLGEVVVVAPLTTTAWSSPVRVEVEPDLVNGLRAVSWVQTDHVRSISRLRALEPLGTLDVMDQVRLDAALRRVLALG